MADPTPKTPAPPKGARLLVEARLSVRRHEVMDDLEALYARV